MIFSSIQLKMILDNFIATLHFNVMETRGKQVKAQNYLETIHLQLICFSFSEMCFDTRISVGKKASFWANSVHIIYAADKQDKTLIRDCLYAN